MRTSRSALPLPPLPLVALTAGLLSGCGAAGRDELARVIVRDSAGITIVESPAALVDMPLGWTIPAAPELRIGVVEGDPNYQLFGLTGTAALPDGGVVTVSAGSQDLRFFDAEGQFVRAVGRRGSGPGEFLVPLPVSTPARDSLLIWDLAGRRFTLLGTDGGLGRIITAAALGSSPMGWLPGGGLLTSGGGSGVSLDSPEGVISREVTYQIVPLDGGAARSVAQFPGPRSFVARTATGVATVTVPFDGGPSAAVGAGHFYVTPGKQPEVRVFDETGALRRIQRVRRPPEALSRSEFDAFVEAQVALTSSPEAAAERRRRFAAMPVPEHRPAYRSLKVDAEGYLWAEHYRPSAAGFPRWTVFDPEGAVRGSVDTPGGLTIDQIGTDFILGRTSDELDIEYAVRYRLMRTP